MVALILGSILVVGILILGARITITKEGVVIDPKSVLDWLRKANEEKGVTANTQITALETRISFEPRKLPIRLPRSIIIWVDDHPLNNQFERLAFASAGIFCDSYTANAEAINAIKRQKPDLVISDIARDERSESGWDLLAEIKREFPNIPFVFYTMGVTAELRSEAHNRGAAGIFELPDELTARVLELTRNTE
jgi:CheY-like chemotaxis protein